MKLEQASLFFSLLLVSATGLAGCAADTSADANGADDATEEVAESEDAITGRAVELRLLHRHAPRLSAKCISPICGGYFVKRVNQATTVCADGSKQAECYVSVDHVRRHRPVGRARKSEFRGAVESGKALVKARMYKKKFNGLTLGTLKANEGWRRRHGLRRRTARSTARPTTASAASRRRARRRRLTGSTAPTITTSSG